jgi:hypothetical protein
MKLNTKALAGAFSLLWGGAILLLAVANMIWPGYAEACLRVIESIYPGYHVGAGMMSVIIGTVYALLDGAVFGAIFGWLYNTFVGSTG